MAKHGWGGDVPSSNAEAIERILDATDVLVAEHGSSVTLADVARAVGVTRQTVYRYFPGLDALRTSCALRSADGFLDQLTARVGADIEPLSALVEGMAFAVEYFRATPQLAHLIAHGDGGEDQAPVISDVSMTFGLSLLQRFPVDWSTHGYRDADLRGLAEFSLRLLHSYLVGPALAHVESPEELRAFLSRWMGPAIVYPQIAQAMAQISAQSS